MGVQAKMGSRAAEASRSKVIRWLIGGCLMFAVTSTAAPVAAALAAGGQEGVHPRQTDAIIRVRPTSGPGGIWARVKGTGFVYSICGIVIVFTDASGHRTVVGGAPGQPTFRTRVQIPDDAMVGPGAVTAVELEPPWPKCSGVLAVGKATFTVTPDPSGTRLTDRKAV